MNYKYYVDLNDSIYTFRNYGDAMAFMNRLDDCINSFYKMTITRIAVSEDDKSEGMRTGLNDDYPQNL